MDIPANEVVVDKPQSEIDPSQVEVDEHIPSDQVQLDSTSKSKSHPVLAGTEGAMRGLTGGLSDAVFKGARHLAEAVTDNPEIQDLIAPKIKDVAERAESTPAKVGEATGVIGGMLTGQGIPGLISKGAKAVVPEATGLLAKAGSAILRGAAEGMALQAGDEVSKAMLGQGDPEDAVSSALARIGGAGLVGGFAGGVFHGIGKAAEKGLGALENAKIGQKAENMLAGMALGAKAREAGVPHEGVEEFAEKYYKDFGADEMFKYGQFRDGVNLYYKGLNKVVNTTSRAAVDATAGVVADKMLGPAAIIPVGLVTDKIVAPLIEKILQKPLIRANKYVMPSVMYALEKGQTSGLFNLLSHTNQMAKGVKAINSGVESVFLGGAQQGLNNIATDQDIKAIKEYMDNGGLNQELQDSLQNNTESQEQFAEGGKVPKPKDSGSIANLYPEQAMIMSSAKGRMSDYLNSLKPQKNPLKLAYDRPMNQKDQEKIYDEAVKVAAAPLSVLDHIKQGTLQTRHINHLNSMYPELSNHLKKKLTSRMLKSQLDGERPKGRTEQALALFLGAPLTTYQTPQGIMAAQSTFQTAQAPQQQEAQNKTKKGTAPLSKMAKIYETSEQSRTARSNK